MSIITKHAKNILACTAISALLIGCSPKTDAKNPKTNETHINKNTAEQNAEINTVAKEYVLLAFSYNQHEEDYVVGTTGVEHIFENAKANPLSLDDLMSRVTIAIDKLAAITPMDENEIRHKSLNGNLVALHTRIRMKKGEKIPFDEETRLLYGAVAPHYTEADFTKAMAAYAKATKADGKLTEQAAQSYTKRIIPKDMLKPVMEVIIDECRKRTKEHIELPAEESFELKFVSGKPWPAFNTYKGNYKSLIEINTDVPLAVFQAIDIGCHEGYPGHHTSGLIAERDRFKNQGWIESLTLPMYSPAGPIAEGASNYGVKLVFPKTKLKAFKQDVLYPMLGFTAPNKPSLKTKEQKAIIKKNGDIIRQVQIHVAREYLDGRMTRDEALAFIMKYQYAPKAIAEQILGFIEAYRGYVINYEIGESVVEAYIDRQVAKGEDPWDAFKYILNTPLSLSDLEKL